MVTNGFMRYLIPVPVLSSILSGMIVEIWVETAGEFYYRRPVFHCLQNKMYLFYHGKRCRAGLILLDSLFLDTPWNIGG
jgi:hypothetical protein